MRIDGRKIAEEIKSKLKIEVENLRERGIVPKIAIVTLGDESSWEVYVRQKIKLADALGIKAVLLNLENAGEQRLLATIDAINADRNYHGIIVQRPLPKNIDRTQVINAIEKIKDIDGFRKDSPYEIPLWLAVKHITETALKENNINKGWSQLNITVIGKGETAGTPVIEGFRALGAKPNIIDSKTKDRAELLKNSDIVVSCVGKSNVISGSDLRNGAILIGVGIRGEDGRARGDYDEGDIEQIAKAYTPTPGGVGPVNLSYLFSNLIIAATQQTIDKI